MGRLTLPFVHRQELVEHAIVNHEHHGSIERVVLQSEETLTGVIGLHIMHIGRGDELGVLTAIGCEGYSTMEEDFEVGPHLFEMLFA